MSSVKVEQAVAEAVVACLGDQMSLVHVTPRPALYHLLLSEREHPSLISPTNGKKCLNYDSMVKSKAVIKQRNDRDRTIYNLPSASRDPMRPKPYAIKSHKDHLKDSISTESSKIVCSLWVKLMSLQLNAFL